MEELLQTLRRDGIVVLPTTFDAAFMLGYLDQCKRWDNHVKQDGVEPVGSPSSTCWSMEDVLRAPGWLEQALEWMPLAGKYLEAPPLLYSVNAFTTYPKHGPTQADIQEFHRDADDVRFVALFCYLTDVLHSTSGPHEFVRGSHAETSVKPDYDTMATIYGPAGTMFLADTSGLHRGVRPTSNKRIMAWARFGVTDPPASYVWDKLAPIPSALLGDRYGRLNREQRDCVRLVVR